MSFGTFTLENEFRDSPAVKWPSFVVGFFFAFRSFIVVLSVHLIGTDPRTGTAINLATGFLLLLVVAFSTLGDVQTPFRAMARVGTVRWALLFVAFSGVSLLWSGAASVSTSAGYWCAMAADVVVVVLLLRAGPLAEASEALMAGYVWSACAVAVSAWIMPVQSDLRLGDEDLLGPNSIGYLFAFAFFFAQYLMRAGRRHLVVPSVLLAVTLLRSLSKTTIVAFLVSEGFLLLRDKSIGRKSKILAVLAAVIVVATSWGVLSSYYDVYANAGVQSTTLSGRIGIWAYFLAEAVEQPWVGHGFDSAWKVIPPFGPEMFEAPHAHNELLQQFYAYGVVGIVLFAGIYFSQFRSIRKLARGPVRTFFLSFLLFVLVRGIADTERFDLSLPMWAVVMLALLIDQARATESESAQGNCRSATQAQKAREGAPVLGETPRH
jgi:exopolysaccharide production protein ExoQ